MSRSSGTPADAHLVTDHLRADMRRLSVRGGTVAAASEIVQYAIALAGMAVLARLLTPDDFGAFAMVGTLIGLVTLLQDFGLPSAAVQSEHIDHELFSDLFWLNLKLNAILALLVCAAAPVLSLFYHRPLAGITVAMALAALVLGASLIHGGLLKRQMRFCTIAVVEITASLVALITAVVAAQGGARYWALVLQVLTFNFVSAAGIWLASGWFPARRGRSSTSRGSEPALRALFNYGKDLTLSRAVTYAGRNADAVLVGRLAGAGPLGFYSKAVQWSILPFQIFYNPLMNVSVAGLSRLQDDEARYRAYFRSAVASLLSVTLPGTALLLVAAQDTVLVFMGPQWLEAVPLLRVLSAASLLASGATLTRWVYMSEGRMRTQLRWSMLSTPVLILGVVAGAHWGALGVACGYGAAACFLAYPSIRYCLAGSRLKTRDLVDGMWRPLTCSFAAVAIFFLIQRAIPASAFAVVRLAVTSGIFASIYLACCLVIPGGRAQLLDLLRLSYGFAGSPNPSNDLLAAEEEAS